jgi:hypothetical protein
MQKQFYTKTTWSWRASQVDVVVVFRRISCIVLVADLCKYIVKYHNVREFVKITDLAFTYEIQWNTKTVILCHYFKDHLFPCAQYETHCAVGVLIGEYDRLYVGIYFFVNRTIKRWNQLPASLLASFPCKLNTFRKTVKIVVTSRGIVVGIVCKYVMWCEV